MEGDDAARRGDLDVPHPTHSGRFGERYNSLHRRRYEWLLKFMAPYVPSEDVRMLDIGRSHLTELVHQRFQAPVDSLGFAADHPEASGTHYSFDLNHAQDRERWRTDLPRYDLIIMAEVIEHLYTSPSLVLAFIKSLLKPNGVLIIQTPNAAALRKRLELLLGRNPYELIREDATNPGHFREYTARELQEFAAGLGLRVDRCVYEVYMDYRFRRMTSGSSLSVLVSGAIANGIYRMVPEP